MNNTFGDVSSLTLLLLLFCCDQQFSTAEKNYVGGVFFEMRKKTMVKNRTDN